MDSVNFSPRQLAVGSFAVAVIGAAAPTESGYRTAEEVGKIVARAKGILLCGGLGGVMEASAKGASAEGGVTVGVLPGANKKSANPYIAISITTGMSDARNVILVRSADIVIAVEGGYGTLSEIAIALKLSKPVIGINTWNHIDGVVTINGVEELPSKLEEYICSFDSVC